MSIALDSSTYIAFGDESVNSGGVFYGLFLIPKDEIQSALDIVAQTKSVYGGSIDSPLHCKELFHQHARAKSEWKNLSEESAVAMCGDILRSLNALKPKFLLGHIPANGFPQRLRLVGKNGHPDLVHKVNEKHLIVWAFFQAAMLLDPVDIIEPIDPVKVTSPKNKPFWRLEISRDVFCYQVKEVFLDREKTPIRWFSKHFQFKTIASDIVIENPKGRSHLPIAESTHRHPLLDVADIFTYSVGRSISQGKPLVYEDFTGKVDYRPRMFEDEIILGGN